MKPFYLNGMFRNMVFALVGIFIPVYLYKLGLNYFGDLRYGIVLVAVYYIVSRLTTMLCVIPVSWVIEKIGFRRSIGLSLLFLSISLSALLWSETYIWLLLVSSVSAGLNISFYWVARNSAISQDSDKKNVGGQMGTLSTVEQLATLLGPLCAGLIIERWGFDTLYFLALIILVISFFPLINMPPHIHKNGATYRGFWYFIRDSRYLHIGIGAGARAVEEGAFSVLWPLAIFVLGLHISQIGVVFSVVAIVTLSVRILMAKIFDKLHNKGDFSDEIVYMISAGIKSITWIVRLFVGSLSTILLLDMTGAVFGTIHSSFYTDYEQLGGKRMGSIAYWVYREMMFSFVIICMFGLVIVGTWIGIWKEMFMILAAVWALISMVMARESNMR